MALLYQAEINPSKLELLQTWLLAQPWCREDPAAAELIGGYRFDDPDGEVGIETHLVRLAGGTLVQAPTTYRDAPLDGVSEGLIGTTDHSVLGMRWVYDGCFDPVYLTALATTILTGGRQADIEMMTDTGRRRYESPITVRGSGSVGGAPTPITAPLRPRAVSSDDSGTTVVTDSTDLTVRRIVDVTTTVAAGPALLGRWMGVDTPVVLAKARHH